MAQVHEYSSDIEEDASVRAMCVQELVENVIDHLHDNKRALARCSLVSRGWSTRARQNLFADIALPTRLTDPPQWAGAAPPLRLSQFHLLARHRPELFRYVKSLRLLYVGVQNLLSEPILPSPWSAVDFSPISCFTNVRSLTITGFRNNTLLATLNAFLAAFPLVQEISFDRFDLRNPHPEPAWHAPHRPVSVWPFTGNHQRPRPLRSLSLLNISARTGPLQCESFALAETLAAKGELGSLTALHLMSGPAVMDTWIPFFPTICAPLEHLSISLNDVVVGMSGDYIGAYGAGLNEQQLREKIRHVYSLLLGCPRLRTICIKYDAFPTFFAAANVNYTNPDPHIQPFFIFELASLLSRWDVPFPHLESLSFDLLATVESLARTGNAWRALRAALTSDGRYPRFSRISVVLEEMTMYAGSRLGQNWDAEVRAAKGREIFRMFEDAGLTLSVSARQSERLLYGGLA